MRVFLDFEASSLGKKSVPIEVAWVFEDGRSASYLIRPAPEWEDWDAGAEAIHHIPRATLVADGMPHTDVARAMVDALSGHRLFASAPSWDGKWLSVLLRSAGFERHTLRLRDTEEVRAESARAILAGSVPGAVLEAAVMRVLTAAETHARSAPARHRALADAEAERTWWLDVVERAERYTG